MVAGLSESLELEQNIACTKGNWLENHSISGKWRFLPGPLGCNKTFPYKNSPHLDVTRESFWPMLTAMGMPHGKVNPTGGQPNLIGWSFTGGTSAENMKKGMILKIARKVNLSEDNMIFYVKQKRLQVCLYNSINSKHKIYIVQNYITYFRTCAVFYYNIYHCIQIF